MPWLGWREGRGVRRGGTFIPYKQDGGPGVISGLATAGEARLSMASR
jgi:hypothetical protein